MKKHVVVITDCKDVAFNEMRWIVMEQCNKLGVENVEVELVPVSEFSVLNAAFLTRLMGEQCSPGTVFSIVINPQRHRSARIFGKTSNGILFFGANTGALTWFLEDLGVEELFEVNDPGFISFGGKYVHAPNVANLAAGVAFTQFGKPFLKDDLTPLPLEEGTVVHIDNFGLLKMLGPSPKYKEGEKLRIFVNEEYKFDATYSERMMSKEDGQWVLYQGSSLHGLPELGTVRHKTGFLEQGIKIGDVIRWESQDHV